MTDHRGQETKIWSRFEDEGEPVQGDRLAARVDEVVASGEAVEVKTRDTQWGLDLVALHRRVSGVPTGDVPDPVVEPDADEREVLEREYLDDEDLPF